MRTTTLGRKIYQLRKRGLTVEDAFTNAVRIIEETKMKREKAEKPKKAKG